MDGRGALRAQVRALLADGFRRQASRLLRFEALRASGSTSALVLAGRVAPILGSERLGAALVLQAVRQDPRSPEARLHAAHVLLDRHGPLVAWMRIREWGQDLRVGTEASDALCADWLGLRAVVAGRFRDFEAAGILLAAAERMAPGRGRTRLARADVLVDQDRREEALVAAREALRLCPGFTEAVQTIARLLQADGRRAEAVDLLHDAVIATEDCRLMHQLAHHLCEEKRYRECLECLDQLEAAGPLIDRDLRGCLESVRPKASIEDGSRGEGERVELPVPFVQQDRFTCSPATLSELATFWGRPQEQAEVAEEICYDGTPRHRAREWAAGQDFAVVEFRATWESVRAVLDRGLPFALVTRGTLSAHDQAVVGYDGGRGTLLIRCPSRPFAVELAAKSLFAEQAWCGPRATILLPTAELPRLSGLDLPDRGAYDHIHALEVALAEHRREDAGAIARQLARLDPRNRLNLWATLCLAHYDRDRGAELQCLEALLVAFPGTAALALWRLQVLADLAHPKIFARGIAEAGRRHPRDPAIQSRLAYELSREPRERERAWSVLRPLLRKGHWPTVALNILTLANMCGDDVRRVRALLSLAAHYNDMQEGLAMAYFKVVDSERRPDDGLRFLEARFTQYGRSSGDPATTLFEALVQAGRTPRAFTVLAKALSLRPHDADLHLFAAGAHAGHGDLDRAEEHLAEARGRTHRADWLRAAAAVAARREDSEGQLRLWHEVLGVQPAAFDAHTAIARLLAALGQPQAAVAHLRRLRHRFPQHHALNELSATAVDGGASPLS